jgi:pantothenate kinase
VLIKHIFSSLDKNYQVKRVSQQVSPLSSKSNFDLQGNESNKPTIVIVFGKSFNGEDMQVAQKYAKAGCEVLLLTNGDYNTNIYTTASSTDKSTVTTTVTTAITTATATTTIDSTAADTITDTNDDKSDNLSVVFIPQISEDIFMFVNNILESSFKSDNKQCADVIAKEVILC